MKKIWTTLTIFLSILLSGAAWAAPKSELWDHWESVNPGSKATIDHIEWDKFLKKYVVSGGDGVNRVRYKDVSQKDRSTLNAYIEKLEKTEVRNLNKSEQLAFWINLYNSLTIKIIMDHYPVDSILDIDISPGLFSNGPWGKKLLEIDGERISLDDIEHRILRPIWKDPRIHYGVNCASIGCPNLQKDAFTSENTEKLLDKGAAEYVNHPRGARITSGKLEVSSIYEWFKKDFGGDDKGVIKHLKKFAAPDFKKKLEEISKISDDQYDWSLNETN